MPRRVSLPGASELFRGGAQETQDATAAGAASGRIRHDEKITVYVSQEELIALEQARLTLRSQGIAVDRGRLVRAAIAAALADLEEHGDAADVISRLGS
jgi:hypothetical protein